MVQDLIYKFKTGVYRDFVLSLLASGITTITTQIITYPLLAKLYSPEEYGRILTIMGVANVLILAFGNSLNNVRLIMNNEYDSQREKGDFLPLLLLLGLFGTIVFSIYLFVEGERSMLLILPLCGFVLFGIVQSYGSVAFRIRIDYSKNLILCCWIAVGNFTGLGLLLSLRDSRIWALTFLFGQLFGIIYLWLKTTIYKEPLCKTNLFSKTAGKELVLLFTTLSANILVYLDRLLLYPLLGGEAVSTYTVASFFGKSLAILMNPISSVLLSYYSHPGFSMTRKKFWAINGITIGISSAFILLSLFISEWVTGILYPSIIDSAKPYLLIANVAAVINVAGTMVSPAVLKFSATSWQAVNQLIYMVVYLGAGVALSRQKGLMGFSCAALFAALIRLSFFYVIGHVSLGKRKRECIK